MKRPALVAVLAVSALLLAACGGDGDGEPGGTRTSTAPSPSTSTTPPSTIALVEGTDPALTARAQAATLQPGDFPTGFEPQPEEPGQGLNIETVWRDLTQCVGVENAVPPAGRATSPTFRRDIATQGRSTVEYTTEPRAAAVAAALAGPRAQECLMRAFVADLDRSKPEGSTPGPVTVTPRDVAQLGQRTLAWRAEASVDLSGLAVLLFQDYLVVFDGGTVIRLFFLSPGAEFPQQLEQELAQKVFSRA